MGRDTGHSFREGYQEEWISKGIDMDDMVIDYDQGSYTYVWSLSGPNENDNTDEATSCEGEIQACLQACLQEP